MAKLIKGFNDFKTKYPEIAKEWNYEKNCDLKPEDVLSYSHRKVWWIGSCGHEWQAVISGRTFKKYGCPYCSGQRVLSGFNDLKTKYPEIAKEWNYEKNGDLKPEQVTSASNKKVWWKCKKDHEWQVSISGRTNGGTGCPVCQKELQTSFPEQAIYYYISKVYPDTKNGDRVTIGKEIDIFIPKLKVGIEFDGKNWHKDKKLDEIKNKLCLEKGIELYRIREVGCPELAYSPNVHIISCDNNIEKSIKDLCDALYIDIDINIERDRINVYEQFIKTRKEKSLAVIYPNIAKEWNYERNGKLSPEHVLPASQNKVWWIGKCGHEWQASINHRTLRDDGCPYCSGHKVLAGFNDLKTKYPEIAKEWNYEKNGDFKPEQVTSASQNKVWWIGKCGHEWQASINHRTLRDDGCPYCSGNKVLAGFNDLKTKFPEIAKEWNCEKNGDLKPEQVTSASKKKVWWIGKCGHEWQATICHRTLRNDGCPYCSGHKVLAGFNDLKTKYPEIAKEWNCEKNGDFKPEQVTSASQNKVWWIGKCGHEWQATICHRTLRNDGCPYCSGHKVLSGFNDLKTKYPEIAREWNYEKNGDLKPEQVTSATNKKVWWIGKCGHEWQASIDHRTLRKQGCPYCSNHKLLLGFNDLKTKYPEIAREWNYEKNDDLKPEEMLSGSRKKVWWKCKLGHEWQTTIYHRTIREQGCPYCKKSKLNNL